MGLKLDFNLAKNTDSILDKKEKKLRSRRPLKKAKRILNMKVKKGKRIIKLRFKGAKSL